MSDMNLKVTPAELEAKAADFKSVMTQTKSLTDDIVGVCFVGVNFYCRRIWIPWAE